MAITNPKTAAEWAEYSRSGHAPSLEECFQLVMKEAEANARIDPQKVKLGLYRVFWKEGGFSLASVGMTSNGGRWLAPINWVAPTVDQSIWESIQRLEAIQ